MPQMMPNPVGSMDSAAMEAVMTDRPPVTTVTFVSTGDPELDLISLVLKYLNDHRFHPDNAIRPLAYIMERVKREAESMRTPNPRWADPLDDRVAIESKKKLAAELAKLKSALRSPAGPPPYSPDQAAQCPASSSMSKDPVRAEMIKQILGDVTD